MTHTAEPMTLAQASALIERIKDQHTTTSTTCHVDQAQLDAIRNAIDAELAKQREAEPEAWAVRQNSGNLLCCENEANARLTAKTYSYGLVPLYTHSQQRNAVEVTDEMVIAATKSMYGDNGIWAKEPMHKALEAALRAFAPRDREDAK